MYIILLIKNISCLFFRTEEETGAGERKGTLKFIKQLTNMTREVGGEVTMKCEIAGDPSPNKIRWFKNEAPLNEERDRIIIKKIFQKVLIIYRILYYFIFSMKIDTLLRTY